MRHKSLIYATLFLACFLLLPPAIQAETIAAGEAQEQKKLSNVIQELEQAAQYREQQNTRMSELSQQLECNWALIRAYKSCGELHKNDPDKHLQCSGAAKQNVAHCIENSGK